MTGIRSLALFGLGQIGGSIALGLRRKTFSLYGFDPDPAARRAARRSGLFERVLGEASGCDADLLLLACPMTPLLDLLERMRGWKRLPRALTDVGSVKTPVVAAMRRLPAGVSWIGGHPLAGTEGRGWAAASADRFRGATWVLTREHRGDGIRLQVSRLVKALGARPATLDAARHDRILARTSHLPYLVSCALVASARAEGLTPTDLGRFSGGGWRDMTRLARSDPRMALGYVRANAAEVNRALARFLKTLRASGPRARGRSR